VRNLKKNIKNVLLYIGIPIILLLAIASVSLFGQSAPDTTYYEIIKQIRNDEISAYTLNLYNGDLKYTTRIDGKEHNYTVADPGIFYEDTKNDVQSKNTDDNPDNDIVMDYKS
jgi:cell division protease FtsH